MLLINCVGTAGNEMLPWIPTSTPCPQRNQTERAWRWYNTRMRMGLDERIQVMCGKMVMWYVAMFMHSPCALYIVTLSNSK